MTIEATDEHAARDSVERAGTKVDEIRAEDFYDRTADRLTRVSATLAKGIKGFFVRIRESFKPLPAKPIVQQVPVPTHVCTRCGQSGWPLRKRENEGLGCLLLLIAFPLGVLYFALTRAKVVCRSCGAEALIPVGSPTVPRVAVQAAPPVPAIGFPVVEGPGRYRIVGVDRETKMDTVWHVDAASRENAKVKAELEGIIVTEVHLESQKG